MRKQPLFSFLLLFLATSISAFTPVHRADLDNGLTVLSRRVDTPQKVSVQLWYNVGSKDEQSNEFGLAHWLEHMIFGGTETLSESDIDAITQKISASCNASTFKDWTRYYFNVPTQHWKKVLPVMADCMKNCTFKEDKLASEVKVVIQELKMRKENYQQVLYEKLMAAVYPDSPYQHPIIGYKQDLWNLSRDNMYQFYQKHYVPNNAVLVVVGDVDPYDVESSAQEYFGHIPADHTYTKQSSYHNKDIGTHSVTIYRDVQVPRVTVAYGIPGIKEKRDFVVDTLSLLLTGGKESRLHKKLVDETQLVRSVGSGCFGQVEHDLFVITFEPQNIEYVEEVIQVINQEFAEIAQAGVNFEELERASRIFKTDLYDTFESNSEQATLLGMTYLSTKDENYMFTRLHDDLPRLQHEIADYVREYMQPFHMHRAYLLPFAPGCSAEWQKIQQQSDQQDTQILQQKIRDTEVEPPQYAHTVYVEEMADRSFPKPQEHVLSNGIKVFSYHRDNIPKISITFDMKVDADYDSDEKPGLLRVLTKMLREGGTYNYSAEQFAHEFESRGIDLSIGAGSVSMSLLAQDLPIALELLREGLMNAMFEEHALEKVRSWALADCKKFWDSPGAIASKLVHDELYPDHPYSKNLLGTEESIMRITRDDLFEFYHRYFSPDDARLAIVGDIAGHDIIGLLENTLGQWHGPAVEDIVYPELPETEHDMITHHINRDQVVLCYAGKSINRHHEDFDALLIFDQIFGNGMSSKLFKLREKSGAFYSISGSLISGAGDEPGMVMINTLVSLDRLQEVRDMIEETIRTVVDTVTEEEVAQAKQLLLHRLSNKYSTNGSIASMFMFLEHFKLPFDHFETRAEQLRHIDAHQVREAARKILNLEKMKVFMVGRV